MKRKILTGVVIIITIGAVIAIPEITGQIKFNKAVNLVKMLCSYFNMKQYETITCY